jgi:glycosyltransferase involved in cell wall biosynthesis
MRNILVLNFFPAFTPPKSGGEQRYFYFYKELSKFFDITLLSPTHQHTPFEVVNHSESLREFRVPKEAIHTQLHLKLTKENVGAEVSGIVNGLSAKFPNEYHTAYNELYKNAEIIIHDSPYMLEYDLFFGMDHKPRIYNSYNHEALLLKQTLTGTNANQFIHYIENMERTLVKNSDLIFVTSLDEKKSFISSYQINEDNILLVPNGIHPNQWAPRGNREESTTAFFIGSAHPPNIEAVDYIVHHLADQCENINFIVAGKCTESFQHIKKSNVKMLGLVDEETKFELFSMADIAINPMFHGAGTNLKTLEYLSAGLPLISTDIGVRGLELIDGVHYYGANKENFAMIMVNRLKNKKGLKTIAKSGQKYINSQYSWKSIALRVKDTIKKLESNKAQTLYLLNDFEASNPNSGGAIRINHLYSTLAKKYRICLLCFNHSNQINKVQIAEGFFQVSVPKSHEHKIEEFILHQQHPVSLADIISSYMCISNNLLKLIHQNLYDVTDVVILVHPYMALVLENSNEKPVIYESLNAEMELKKTILKNHPKFDLLIKQVMKVEELACEKSQFMISVSDCDHQYLRKYLKEEEIKDIITINNGVQIRETSKYNFTDKTKIPNILFIDSGHPPNNEAVHFIIEKIAPFVKANFIIVGSVCHAFAHKKIGPNIKLMGEIDHHSKISLMENTDIALNPMINGSGSNVKMADYFANRLPTITTPVGARGYNIKNGQHAIICDSNEFSSELNALIKNMKLQETLAKNAFHYAVQELDWERLAEKFDFEIQKRIFNNNPH